MAEDDQLEDESPIQSRELFALLGEFLVRFQYLCANLHVGITALDDVVGSRKGRVVNSLMVEMPASALLRSFNSVLRERRELSQFETLVLSKIYDRTMRIIEKRNELIHGQWFVVNPDDFSFVVPPITASSSKHTKRGVRDISINVSAKYLQSVVDECNEMSILILTAWTSFLPEQNFDNGFLIDERGNLLRKRASDAIPKNL